MTESKGLFQDVRDWPTSAIEAALWCAGPVPREVIEESVRRLNEAEETSAFIGSKGLGDEFTAWALARRAEIDRLLRET